MNNTDTQTNATTTTNATKKATKNLSAQKTAFLNSREKEMLNINFSETKSLRLADKYIARQVKNLVNQIARVESTEDAKVSALSVLNDFRKGNFSDSRLTENRIKAYIRQLKAAFNKSDADFTAEDVKRDLMRQASVIWKSGKF